MTVPYLYCPWRQRLPNSSQICGPEAQGALMVHSSLPRCGLLGYLGLQTLNLGACELLFPLTLLG